MRPLVTTILLTSLLAFGGFSIASVDDNAICPHDHESPKACRDVDPASIGGVRLEHTVVSQPMSADGSPAVPCADPRGCPDLTTDPEKMDPFIRTRYFSSQSCSVIEGHTERGSRKLLLFTFTTPNFGSGDLIVGAPRDHPEWFVWSSCHGHYHFRDYADYRLWTTLGYQILEQLRIANPDATTGELITLFPFLEAQYVAGHKQGFCVIDIIRYQPGAPSKYWSCSSNQGISVGWADEYYWGLDGQWVDVTGVSPGSYILEAEVNSERLYDESNYANNAAAVAVTLT